MLSSVDVLSMNSDEPLRFIPLSRMCLCHEDLLVLSTYSSVISLRIGNPRGMYMWATARAIEWLMRRNFAVGIPHQNEVIQSVMKQSSRIYIE
jgi:hypothetical protein